ncbi:hypothetical protein AYO40_04160 [Planctomycetaceae bacterium SCGC AG-212-D15]|nr:hypothetical protein AYO40_04160 [Planctomycetaceae bacterium SCGC AG-212-D15]
MNPWISAFEFVLQWKPLWVPLFLGALAIYLALPRPQPYARWLAAVTGALAILAAAHYVLPTDKVNAPVILFYAFSLIAVVSGAMMLAQSNPVHAALSFALVVLSTCGLFLLQAAPFLMAATIIVYAGAIVVTFLFVMMLAQQSGRSDADRRSREPLLAAIAGFVLLGAIFYLLHVNYDTTSLDAWLARIRQAEKQETVNDMANIVVTRDEQGESQLFDEIGSLRIQPSGFLNQPELKDRVPLTEYKVAWEMAWAREDLAGMRQALEELEVAVLEARNEFGSMTPQARPLSPFSMGAGALEQEIGRPAPGRLPVDNPGGLGRTLFSDFLIAVELAGTLLLVAAVGAIAIAHRRTEDLR